MTKSSWGSRYAIAASTLALLIALSGTAYAVNTVRSADIVDGTIKSIDIRNSTVATTDIAPGSLGRSPRLWARILGSDGSLQRGRGVTTTGFNGTGSYDIDFNRDISQCGVTATPDGLALLSVQVMNDNVSVFARDLANQPVSPTNIYVLVVC